MWNLAGGFKRDDDECGSRKRIGSPRFQVSRFPLQEFEKPGLGVSRDDGSGGEADSPASERKVTEPNVGQEDKRRLHNAEQTVDRAYRISIRICDPIRILRDWL